VGQHLRDQQPMVLDPEPVVRARRANWGADDAQWRDGDASRRRARRE
jgi:hypothetical protein